MAIAKKRPMRPRTPILRYHTPNRSFTGHRGNMTPASIMRTIARPPRYVVHCDPS